MSVKYPLHFTLSDGVHVVVSQVNNTTFNFSLKEKEKTERHFTLEQDGKSKDDLIEALDFDELNAVRRFWLEVDEH